MRIANKNNNENVSFGSFVTHLQKGMKTPISEPFMERMAQLIGEFANHPRLHLSIYDVFSPEMVNVGYAKRTIGASLSVQEGYKVPGFKLSDFMVNALADSDGAKFEKSIRDLSTDLEFQILPDFSNPFWKSNLFDASNPSNPFGVPMTEKVSNPPRIPKRPKPSRIPVSQPVSF